MGEVVTLLLRRESVILSSKVRGTVSHEECGQLGVKLRVSPTSWCGNDTRIILQGPGKTAEVVSVEGHDDPALGHRKLVNLRVVERAMVQVVSNVFDVKMLIESGKRRARWHVLIEEQFVLVEAFRHGSDVFGNIRLLP